MEKRKGLGLGLGLGFPFALFSFPFPPLLFAPATQAKRVSDVNPMA